MEPDVLVPAGLPILEAAAWVGHSCWAELALHDALTGWLTDEDDAEVAVAFWGLRAQAAARAEAWHRRLPELREFPRATFLQAPEGGIAEVDALGTLTGVGRGPERLAALDSALARLVARGETHRRVALGPADGPIAGTLGAAVEGLARDRGLVAELAKPR